MAAFRDARGELLEQATRLIGELYRVAGFEEVAKHVEYVLATQPEGQRKLFAEALQKNVPGRGGELMNYVDELIEQGRQEGRREGESKGRQEGRQEGRKEAQLGTIEQLVRTGVAWTTIEAATGIDERTFDRLKQQLDA